MNIIQKYKTYKDLKRYLAENFANVELITECPKIDICRQENNYCFYSENVYPSCLGFDIHVDKFSMRSFQRRNHYKRPMDKVDFVAWIDNTNGILPNTPKTVINADNAFARYINDLVVTAYREKLVAEHAKLYRTK